MNRSSLPPIVIRNAFHSEAELLTELGFRSKSIWGYSDEQMSTFRKELIVTTSQIASGLVFASDKDSAVVGYYILKPLGGELIELEHLFICPDHIRTGIGSSLFRHAIRQSQQQNFRRLKVQSDPNASAFYLQFGPSQSSEISSSIPGRTIPEYEFYLDDFGK